MKTLELIILIIKCWPEISKILALLEKRQEELATDEKIKADLKVIGDAFETQDNQKLRDLFNSP